MKLLSNVSPALVFTKFGLFFPLFLGLHACSQSPAPPAGTTPTTSFLKDSASSLGNSADNGYRLFKASRVEKDKSTPFLFLLRLGDMREALIGDLPTQVQAPQQSTAKFQFSKDSKWLLAEVGNQDSTIKKSILLFDLANFRTLKKFDGEYLSYDPINEVVFYYRSDAERQSICHVALAKPELEKVRDIIAPPNDRLPSIIFNYKERQAKVKAYTTGNVPVNVVVKY